MLNYYGVSVFHQKNDSKSICYYKYLYNFLFIFIGSVVLWGGGQSIVLKVFLIYLGREEGSEDFIRS